MIIRALQLAFIVLSIAIIYPFSAREPVLFPKDTATSDGVVRMQKSDRLPQPKESGDDSIVNAALPPAEQQTAEQQTAEQQTAEQQTAEQQTAGQQIGEQQKAADDRPFFSAHSAEAGQPDQDLVYLAYYAYSEVPPDKKPADTVLAALKEVPVGTPVEEIKRASDAL